MAAECRFCATPLEYDFVDLGMSPLSNAFLKADDLNRMERFYPLRAYVCGECYLVQLEEFEAPAAIFPHPRRAARAGGALHADLAFVTSVGGKG